MRSSGRKCDPHKRPVEPPRAPAYAPAMKPRSFPAVLLAGGLLLSLAAGAFAVPKRATPNNQANLQRTAAAARQHQLLAAHTQAAQQQHLLKTRENFTKQHIIEQARRPIPAAPPQGREYGDPVLRRELPVGRAYGDPVLDASPITKISGYDDYRRGYRVEE